MDGITDSLDMSLSKLREIMKDREAWHGTVHGVMSQTRLSNNKMWHGLTFSLWVTATHGKTRETAQTDLS